MQHRVINASVMSERVATLHRGQGAVACYTDPPWGNGMLSQFRTIARKHGGNVPEQPTEDAMLERLTNLAWMAGCQHLMVLYGLKGAEKAAQACGTLYPHVEWSRVTYEKRECAFIAAGNEPVPPAVLDAARRYEGGARAWRVISAVAAPGSTVIEPFAGSGTFSAAMAKAGYRVLASEYDPRKARKCAARLGVMLG